MNKIKTKTLILESANDLFALNGFDGTSVSSIVGGAGVNKRMLYHYFENKEGLYRSVFIEQWENFAKQLNIQLQPLYSGNDSPERAQKILLGTVGAYFDYMATQPNFVRLIAWEGLEGGAISRSLWENTSGPLFRVIANQMISAQKHGILSTQLHVPQLIISLMGMVTYYFTFGASLDDLIGGPIFTPKALATRRSQLQITVKQILLTP